MAIQTIVSGSGFGGLIPYDDSAVGTDRQGSAGATGYDKKAIARWTEPPCSLYRENTIVGLMAFHADGIKEVDFVLNGGTTITVDKPEFNPLTGFNEYCVQINRNDVVGAMGEEFNNLELRAIVRPNVGIPRVLQHDIVGISGPEASIIFNDSSIHNYFTDTSAGPSGDGYMSSGEMSFLATMFEDNSSSSLPDVEIFVSPTGNDSSGTGTRSNPVQTIEKALEKMQNGFQTSPNPAIGSWVGTSNTDQYIDRGIITLLAGTYNENHLHIQNTPSYKLDQLYTYLIVRGDPQISSDMVTVRDSVILKLDDKTQTKGLNICDIHQGLGLLKLENLTIDNTNTEWSEKALFFTFPRARRDAPTLCIDTSLIPSFIIPWINNVYLKSDTYSDVDYADIFDRNNCPDPFKGPIATNCEIFGGTSVGKGLSGIVRNVRVEKSGEDQSFGTPLIIGLFSKQAPGAFAKARRIDFYDPANPDEPHPDYGKFNGWYVIHPVATDLQAGPNLDSTLSTYFDSTITNPQRFSMIKYLDGNGVLRLDGDGTSNLGGLWRKIKEENWFGTNGFSRVRLPTIEEIPDDYFDTRDISTSLAYKCGSVPIDINYAKGSANELTDEERAHYFDNKWMSALFIEDFGDGLSGAGYALFDTDSPFVYGTNVNQQKYLWRQGGTTANVSGGRRFIGNYLNLYTLDSFQNEEYEYGWAEGATSSIFPQHGCAKPTDQGPGTNDSHPISSRAVSGSVDGTHADMFQWTTPNTVSNLWLTLYDGVPTPNSYHISNNIFAYNIAENFIAQAGQLEHHRLGITGPSGFKYIECGGDPSATDIAMVNNLIAGGYGYVSNMNLSTRMKNFLMEHNTFLNTTPGFGESLQPSSYPAEVSGITAYADLNGVSITAAGGTYTFNIGNDDWTVRNNIFDGVGGFAFNNYNNSISFAFVKNEDNGRSPFIKANTISESNYIYPHDDTPPAPGQLKQFLDIDVPGGVTGFIQVAQDRKLMLDFYEGIDSSGQILPNYVGQYKILPVGPDGKRSPIIGGATNSSVYDDINRIPRNERATVGCVEYNQFLENGSIIGDGTNSTTFTLSDLGIVDYENIYGKKIKIRGFTNGEEVLSTNSQIMAGYYQQPFIDPGDLPDTNELDYTFENDFSSTVRSIYYAYRNVNDNAGYNGGIYPPPSDPADPTNEFTRADDINWLSEENDLVRIHLFSDGYSPGNWKNRVIFIFGNSAAKNNFVSNVLGSDMIEMEFSNGVTCEIVSANQIALSAGFDSLASGSVLYEIQDSSGVTFGIPTDGIFGPVIIKRPV